MTSRRQALRALWRNPGFSALAVSVLALGIGANTTIFSVVHAIVLRPLPFQNPERLVTLEPVRRGETTGANYADFADWRAQSTVFEEMALDSYAKFNLTGQSFPGYLEPERLVGRAVTAGYFQLLGMPPELGRWFRPDDDRAVLLTYGLWQRRFGGRTDILGQSLTFDGLAYTIVGIMPAAFRLPNMGFRRDFWVPLTTRPNDRGSHQYTVIGRLRPGVTVEGAQTELRTIARRLEQEHPETNTGWGVRVEHLTAALQREARAPLLILVGAVAAVLLIACANVASLLLARSVTRRQELAVRAALGAGRARLVRMLLAESLLLAATGGALGVLLARWGLQLAEAVVPAQYDLAWVFRLDPYALAFTLVASLFTGLVTGVVPAIEGSKADLRAGVASGRQSRFFDGLVVAEIALTAVLLVAAGLLLENLVRLLRRDPGFRAENVLTLRLELPRRVYREPAQAAQFYQTLLERAARLPSAETAGAASSMPMSQTYQGGSFRIGGRPDPPRGAEFSAGHISVSPGYFRALGIPLLRGRLFTDQDRQGSAPVAIINDSLARRYFPGEDPVGRRLQSFWSGAWHTIVGVVGGVRHWGPRRPPEPEIYFAQCQHPAHTMFVVVRTAGNPASLAAALRGEVRALDRDLPVSALRTMRTVVSEVVWPDRLLTGLLAVFAAVALVLGASGLFGVVSYAVSRRTHELGVRVALGAAPSDLFRLVLGHSFRLVLAGLLLGLVGAWGLSRVMGSVLHETSSRDPVVFAAVLLLLAVVALAAGYLPARRAIRIDPLAALRQE